MKVDWKVATNNMMGAMGMAIAACMGGTLLAGAGWVMLWMFKALAMMVRSI
jgi:hypothetical protein